MNVAGHVNSSKYTFSLVIRTSELGMLKYWERFIETNIVGFGLFIENMKRHQPYL